ncbi:MAG: HAD family phosphatase [Anaerolineae bacterium]|nr:HAD family phosphatase [Anaerolineae bacterium]
MQPVPSVTQPIRLLVLDVDGTLVGAERNISPIVVNTLQAVRQRGVHIALCTGRPMFATRRYVEELQLPGYHIFDAGGSIIDPLSDKTLFQLTIERPLARQLLAYAQRAGLYIEVYANGGWYIAAETPQSRMHQGVMNIPPRLANLSEIVEQYTVTKLEILTLSDNEFARMQALADHFADQIDAGWASAPGTPACYVNILPKGISKGQAVGKLAAHLSIPQEQIMGVGDGQNDMALLEASGVRVAMGDAPDVLKQVATWITGTVEQDGLAQAVERFILGNGRV